MGRRQEDQATGVALVRRNIRVFADTGPAHQGLVHRPRRGTGRGPGSVLQCGTCIRRARTDRPRQRTSHRGGHPAPHDPLTHTTHSTHQVHEFLEVLHDPCDQYIRIGGNTSGRSHALKLGKTNWWEAGAVAGGGNERFRDAQQVGSALGIDRSPQPGGIKAGNHASGTPAGHRIRAHATGIVLHETRRTRSPPPRRKPRTVGTHEPGQHLGVGQCRHRPPHRPIHWRQRIARHERETGIPRPRQPRTPTGPIGRW